MSAFKFFSASGAGEKFASGSNYSQAVLLPNGILKLSGQGGWDPETGVIPPNDEYGQLDLAFQNIQRHLDHFGYTWKDVYQVRSYHINFEGRKGGALIKKLADIFPPNQRPIMTAVEVVGLYGEMKVEIEVEAWKAPV